MIYYTNGLKGSKESHKIFKTVNNIVKHKMQFNGEPTKFFR